ncbi:MAG: AAA family ATPase [Cryobacterium sp.]|nr:AAA family ATPase [Oligoflexia bacterium]
MRFMPHLRARHAISQYLKLKSFWPVVGLLGPRQSGKSTFLREFGGLSSLTTLDDIRSREEAKHSPSEFLAKQSEPAGIDEVQKAPALFDAIKLEVDRRKRPGRFILSGSTQFSSRVGIRESLTGRIGSLELHPMNLSELEGASQKTASSSRFSSDLLFRRALAGGMPVPAFMRDEEQRKLYWSSWVETTVLRDLPALYRSGFDTEFAFGILNRMGAVLREGELPTLRHFDGPARKVRAALETMEILFLLRRITCHASGVGKDAWIFMDSGLSAFLMGNIQGAGATLSIVRHFIWNEWSSHHAYAGKRLARVYYKSAVGTPVDLIYDSIPYRIVGSAEGLARRRAWEERALAGAMKKLGSKIGFLVGPTEVPEFPKKGTGIGVLPWAWWS